MRKTETGISGNIYELRCRQHINYSLACICASSRSCQQNLAGWQSVNHVNPSTRWFFSDASIHIFISRHWFGAGSWRFSCWKIGTRLPKHSHYRWPGHLRNQGFSMHDIDLVYPEYAGTVMVKLHRRCKMYATKSNNIKCTLYHPLLIFSRLISPYLFHITATS